MQMLPFQRKDGERKQTKQTGEGEQAQRVIGERIQCQEANTVNEDISSRCPSLREIMKAGPQNSIEKEVASIMGKLMGCSVSISSGKLYLHCSAQKRELALNFCQYFDTMMADATKSPSHHSSGRLERPDEKSPPPSEFDEIVVKAARRFFPDIFRDVKSVDKGNGKVVLSPSLRKQEQDRISSLQRHDVEISAEERGKARTVQDAFQTEDVYVEFMPVKDAIAVVTMTYEQLQSVIHKLRVLLGQIKPTSRKERQIPMQTGNSDLDDKGAAAAVERAEGATKGATGGDNLQVTLPGGLVVNPYRADITRLNVDAIVNAANEDLRHDAGVARAISDAAGLDLDQEGRDYIDLNGLIPVSGVCITGPGHMPCTRVIHAVGPRWDFRTPEVCRKLLYDTVMNCCREAEIWELGEIAMPPISSGIFGMPKDQCTEIYCKALLDFDQQANKKLKTVHFVDINNDMPQALLKALKKEIAQGQQRTGSAEAEVDMGEGCVICTGREFDQPVKLNDCNHVFCKACIEQWFQNKPTCPSCNKVYGIITGTMPEGTMQTQRVSYFHLAGYGNCGCIEINYSFFDCIQQAEHPNPGQRYRVARRTAYLPDNAEGRKVLRLLEEAWKRRLTFTIGRSTITGQENVVTWNGIHHKTSTVSGHPFGYPDPEYLKRVQEELAARGVTEESIKMAESGKAQDFSQFYTPVIPQRPPCV